MALLARAKIQALSKTGISLLASAGRESAVFEPSVELFFWQSLVAHGNSELHDRRETTVL